MAEAQKLISLSITKIKASRGQRGGINLCKNLLVSTVLFKARTAYMKNNFSNVLTSKRSSSDEVEVAEKRAKTEENVEKETAGSDVIEEVTCPAVPIETSDQKCVKDNTDSGILSLEDKENAQLAPSSVGKDNLNEVNTTPSDKREVLEVKDVNTLEDGCGKCLKRRRSVTSNENEDKDKISKKLKSDDTREKKGQSEGIQTDSSQISSLVNIFSSSFSGLLTNVKTESEESQKQSLTTQLKCDISQKSCSTILKENIGSISRPVLALTV